MKPLTVLLLCALPATAHAAELAHEARFVGPFQRIVLRGIGDLELRQGNAQQVIVEAERSALSRIVTRVRGDTLYLEIQGALRTEQPVRYRVTAVQLNGLVAEGSGEIVAAGLRGRRLELSSSGSATVRIMRLDVDELALDAQGSGSFVLSGDARSQKLRLGGSGQYDARSLRSEEVAVLIGGAFDAQVSASRRLDVDISGSGTVTYWGNPQVTERITGAGSVDRAR
jgi:hypothetical protein